jgi:D-alanyl-D-alanine carboxypeptidase
MTKDLLILLWCIALAALAGIAAVLTQPERSNAAATHGIPQRVTEVALDPDALEAQAAVLMDASTGDVLFEKNAQTQRPLASLTKLATALAVLSQDPDRLVTIRAHDIATEGDSGLRAGDVWPLKELVAFALTVSSNDAMSAASQVLTEAGTLESMNAAAAAEGLGQSYFLNSTGLDLSPSTAGAYGSALDTAKLARALLRQHPDVFEATVNPPKPHGDSGRGAVSTLEPLWGMPGLIAAKTGYTELAGGNLAAVVDIGVGEPVIAVVLGSSRDGRFTDLEKLIDAARAAYVHDNL